MTTLAVDRSVTAASRVLAVTRLQLTTNPILVGMPLVVLAAAFVVNLMVFSVVDAAAEQGASGGLASIYFTQLVLAWVTLHQGFSFTVGLNVTRRAFYLASVLIAVLQSLGYGLVIYLGGVLERATGDWGVNLAFFNPRGLPDDASPAVYLAHVVPMAFATVVGLFLGAVSKRFGTRGFFLLSVAAILVLGLAVTLITYFGGWGAIWGWLGNQSLLSILIGWTLIPTALFAIGSWLALRRAVP